MIASDGEGISRSLSRGSQSGRIRRGNLYRRTGNSKASLGNSHAVRVAREAYDKGKLVGAICLAPGVLAEAGILQDKKATIFPSAIDKLKESGSVYVNQSVVRDGNIITANGPEATEKFGEEIRDSLSSKSPI